MKYVMLAVRDAKSEIFGRPFFVQSTGIGIRSFCDEVNRKEADNVMYHHPSDFSLYHLGYFDDDSGKTDSITPKLLMVGNEASVKAVVADEKISKV